VPAAGAEPRTHELTNKGPSGAARQGRSVTNVESQVARSGKPYAARQAITIGAWDMEHLLAPTPPMLELSQAQ
jgi:hypothetical protein